jgi:hypothetical protein
MKMEFKRSEIASGTIDPTAVSNFLSLAKFGISQTRLPNLLVSSSSNEKETFLEFLISLGLVQIERNPAETTSRESKNAVMIYTTEKGFRYLRCYNSLLELSGGSLFR